MVTITYLADHPEHIPMLAAWHHAQWGHWSSKSSVAARAEELRKQPGKWAIPTTFVAVDGPQVFGSASLVEHDLDLRPELTPWLASVYVDPVARGQGIASRLVERAIAEAQRLGVERLYLFTPDRESLYARIGWTVRERLEYHDEQIVVMEYEV
jgi:predicted N-acetyltransferase YhbS